MTVVCQNCGNYEVSPKLYRELCPLPETDWRIERLRSELVNTADPKMIWEPTANIPAFATIDADKPTKLQKRFLRAKAEGKTITVGTIFRAGEADDEPGK